MAYQHLGVEECEEIQLGLWRKESVRSIAERLGRSPARAGGWPCVRRVAYLSPFRQSRALAREMIGTNFIELYVESSHATRVARDPKGLYRRASAGEITDLIGHGGVPYEPPEHPDITITTDTETLDQGVSRTMAFLDSKNMVR